MSKWISVEERLLPIGEKVLCYYKEKIDGLHEEEDISFALYYGGNRRIWWLGSNHAKERSKTFPGIAKAMAEQYGGDIRDEFTDGISSWR